MIYSFEDAETGEPVDVDLPMADAPQIGAILTVAGRRLRRLPERTTQANVKYDGVFRNYQVRRGSKEAQGADFYDKKGVPCFKSRASARDWVKKRAARGLEDTFDG